MGYTHTLPYQLITIKGQSISSMQVQAAGQDIDIGNLVIPAFTNPPTIAYMDVIIQMVRNSAANANYLTSEGSIGIVDTAAAYHAAGNLVSGMAYVVANGNWQARYTIVGTNNIAPYITPGATQMALFKDVHCNGNDLFLQNVYAELRMYFGV